MVRVVEYELSPVAEGLEVVPVRSSVEQYGRSVDFAYAFRSGNRRFVVAFVNQDEIEGCEQSEHATTVSIARCWCSCSAGFDALAQKRYLSSRRHDQRGNVVVDGRAWIAYEISDPHDFNIGAIRSPKAFKLRRSSVPFEARPASQGLWSGATANTPMVRRALTQCRSNDSAPLARSTDCMKSHRASVIVRR
jgi:hypothetical protein